MNISACILSKNEEACIERLLSSLRDHVEEIVLVDDYSTDRTVEIAKQYDCRVYTLPQPVVETGFAISNTWVIHRATKEWTLFIDADELISDIHMLDPLMRYPGKDVWALPRRKWINFDQDKREEYERYPDWQIRFFRNKPGNRFEGSMHVRFKSEDKIHYAYRGPHVEHLQSQYRDTNKLEHRASLYAKLAKLQGVAIIGGDVLHAKQI